MVTTSENSNFAIGSACRCCSPRKTLTAGGAINPEKSARPNPPPGLCLRLPPPRDQPTIRISFLLPLSGAGCGCAPHSCRIIPGPHLLKLPEGRWLTSLACIALLQSGESEDRVAAGANWLCGEWPGDSQLWRVMIQKLFANKNVLRQNSALRGWSWTPGTSSWVEPTACALILLHELSKVKINIPEAEKRRALAEAMLYDRMCPGGGWNSGNSEVYGVAGEPLTGPTVWALLALQGYRDRSENQMGLQWLLSGARIEFKGPDLIALAQICFRVYGSEVPSMLPALRAAHARNQFMENVVVTAMCAMALDSPAGWLQWEWDH